MQGIVDDCASAQDMLGDIDALVIADQFNISQAAGKKVSELLRTYYLGAVSTADGRDCGDTGSGLSVCRPAAPPPSRRVEVAGRGRTPMIPG